MFISPARWLGCLVLLIGPFSLGQVWQCPCAAQDSASKTLSEFPRLSSTDWPWWRGPARNGHASADANVPTKFGWDENILWKTPIPGRGHSSPVVAGGHILVASASEQDQRQAVIAYDLETGKQVWIRQLNQGGFPERNHPKNTEASPTIASDGERIYVTFFNHWRVSLHALDFAGRPKWEKVVSPFNPQKYEYGYAPSPVLYKNSVIVSAEHDGPSSLVAFDRRSGRELWRTPRTSNITFSSPVVTNISGKDQLLISGSGQVSSYDPANGRLLWTVDGTTAATCGTMVWDGDLAIASGGYPKPETIAVRADGSGQVAWKNSQKCYEQSMIVVDGFVFGLTDRGILYCWRGQDGQEMWRERLAGPVSASPILAGGNIYWANESGTVYVFRPKTQGFELVSENRLGSEAFASPAVTGDRLIFRVAQRERNQRQEYLVCVGK